MSFEDGLVRAEGTVAPRTISIFLSAPGDITEERAALASLVSEINDVVTFLAPERNIVLKLIDYQKDTYPAIGSGAQPQVNRQIPVNYDIHFGIMWKRCGTPTENADSGTVEEFDRALKHREQAGRPTIMFYFSGEDIALPTNVDDIEQLARVLRFRQRLERLGLTGAYPSRAAFRERARTGLLRAVADILRDDLPDRADRATATLREVPAKLRDLAVRYDDLRRNPPGNARTRMMQAVFNDMKASAAAMQDSLPLLQNDPSAGARLAAVAILSVLPLESALRWLAMRLDPELEKPFVGFQAALALLQAVRSLPSSSCDALRENLTVALDLAKRNADDPPRIEALDYAFQELRKKESQASSGTAAAG